VRLVKDLVHEYCLGLSGMRTNIQPPDGFGKQWGWTEFITGRSSDGYV